MSIIRKSRWAPRGVALFAALLPLVLSAAAVPDADGDLLPDASDPAPLLANLPFHWSVEAISCRVRAGAAPGGAVPTNGLSAPLYAARSPVALSSPSGLTAAPSFRGRPRGFWPAFAPFGDGAVRWGREERFAAGRAKAALAPLRDGTPVDFVFVVHFTNLGSSHLRLSSVAVPVGAGEDGEAAGTAAPDDARARDNGFLLPGDGKTYMLPFSATMDVSAARAFLDVLSSGDRPPCFRLSRAAGVEVAPDGGEPFTLDAALAGVLARTAPVRVEGASGESWLWRVAKRRPDGKRAEVSDWAGAVNGAASAPGFLGRPVAAFDGNGFPLSLAGWDTGTWDDWWRPSAAGRDRGVFGCASIPVGRGVAFSLRHSPPPLSSGERRRYFPEGRVPPVYTTLLAVTLWNEGERGEARRLFRQAAEAGSAQARSWLGFSLGEDGVAGAVENYKRAADMGYAPGEAWYGNRLLRGHGVKEDRAAALAYLGKAAAQKYAGAQALYGLCLLRGVGVEADPPRAMELLRDASARGDATAQLGVGAYLCQHGDAEGAEWVRLAAAGGNARAQTLLAGYLQAGSMGLAPDPAAAAKWYGAAAKQGDARAMVALGEAFRAGRGVRRDPRRAARLFREAAEDGDPQGQTWYALCLLDGLGTRRDAREAVEWLGKAAGRGCHEAQYVLGLCLYGGIGGTTRDAAAAVRWFKEASAAQPQARIFLGYCYFAGEGVGEDKPRAVGIFAEAARKGSVAAQLWLAYCFANGEGADVDVAAARKWAKAAADRGSPAGKAMLDKLPPEEPAAPERETPGNDD